MLSGIWIAVLAACYSVALTLEATGLKRRFTGRRVAMAVFALTGFAIHSVVLANSFFTQPVPLSTPAEWLSAASWSLALVYLAALLYLPNTPSGIILLPLVLALVVASQVASNEPFAPDRTFYFWGLAHGLLLLGRHPHHVRRLPRRHSVLAAKLRPQTHPLDSRATGGCRASNGWRTSTAACSPFRRY